MLQGSGAMSCREDPQAFPTTAKACIRSSWSLGICFLFPFPSQVWNLLTFFKFLQDVAPRERGRRQGSGEVPGMIYPRKEKSRSNAKAQGNDRIDALGDYFDPVATKALVWKQDLRIVPLAASIYLLCYLDRSNIGESQSAHLAIDQLTGLEAMRRRSTLAVENLFSS